jgi:nucleotide-binding universal stress UspA family protein
MFHKILVPLDGSPLAEKALKHARQLSTPGSTELILVNIIETFRYNFSAMDMVPVDTLVYIRRSMEAYMDSQRNELIMQHFTVQTHVIDGDAAAGILDIADVTGADLIVMTTHGRSGVDRWIMGSVAERVVHSAPIPVWLVRNATDVTPLHTIERILVPLDGSTMAEQALEQAQLLARQTDAELLLLRIVPEPEDMKRSMILMTESSAQKAIDKQHEHAELYLAQLAQTLTSAGLRNRTLVTAGTPVESILETVAAEDVDCIVMATHARLGVDRLLHGSVAAQVLHRCERPMLLVHATDSFVAPRATPHLVQAKSL